MDVRRAVGALVVGVVMWAVPGAARADSCDDECDGPSCSASSRCPESGIECYVDDDADALAKCQDDALAKGYELRCERSYYVYCDPNEADPEAAAEDDEGCAVRGAPRARPGLTAALATFVAAAAWTAARARRRRRS